MVVFPPLIKGAIGAPEEDGARRQALLLALMSPVIRVGRHGNKE
jgi:hypothetical protein